MVLIHTGRDLGVWIRVGGYLWIGMNKTGTWDVIIKSSIDLRKKRL